jgi:hypothetical protein
MNQKAAAQMENIFMKGIIMPIVAFGGTVAAYKVLK